MVEVSEYMLSFNVP